MRVLFLTLYPEAAASPRYRVHQFLPHLEAHGIECTVRAPLSEAEWRRHTGPNRQGRAFWYHAKETPRRLAQLLEAGKYDVAFLQKAVTSAYIHGLDRLLCMEAKKLVLDVDDAVHLAPPHPLPMPWRLAEDRGQVARLMVRADLVLAGNAWLAGEVKARGGTAVRFPTVVDTDRFVPPAKPPETFRVGWMGAPSTAGALKAIAPVLNTLGPEEVILAGASAGQVHLETARIEPWQYDTEVQLLQQLSAGLMPLPRDTWSRGKCALKALLYMAVGVPCIATPWGAVLDIIRHGENGFFAETDAEWREALEALRDPGLRQRMGDAARATVEAEFSLRVAAPALAGYLEGL